MEYRIIPARSITSIAGWNYFSVSGNFNRLKITVPVHAK